MSMTHLSEISAKNRYQKTGNRFPARCVRQFGTDFFRYRFSVTNRTMLYFRAVLWYRFSALIFGADFWYVCYWHKSLYGSTKKKRNSLRTCSLNRLDIGYVIVTQSRWLTEETDITYK